ncbi:hypothetical protein EQW76_00545 [Rhizobium sp. rho-13.1]|uniref:hypothetical protein n=1 Tax=Rhizobium sp. rho-13.1 TaxID=2506431 RepID=UPI00115CC8D3|nr:hypothetical protein [Rhizobium sp. rho-13.1]TQX91264.1 hypothetical protein EQW76_00545 [Rhizobium sp. rho-13.1]
MTEINHTPLPWKAVQVLRFTMPGGLIYTSVEPVEASDATHRHLKMADGTYHVCHLSHTGDNRVAALRGADAEFIVRACNAHYDLLAGIKHLSEVYDGIWAKMSDGEMALVREAWATVEASVAKAEGRSNG